MKHFLLIIVSLLSLSSFSQSRSSQLSPVPENPRDLVSEGEKSQLSCSEVKGALLEYNKLARANEQAFADFIMEVTTVMYDWHSTLSSFEGTSQTLPRGTFDPVREGAQQIDEVVGLVYENSDQLAARIQIILTALDNCL